MDFLVKFNSRVLPIEVKSGNNYKYHKALDNLMGISNYALDEAYIFGSSNIERDGDYTYFPIYMIDFLMKRDRYMI